MADARGCEVWGGYTSRHEGGAVRVYATNVNLCLDADVDKDGALDGDDVNRFGASYVQGSIIADVNRDSIVNANDLNHFVLSYSCACNP